MKKKPQHCFAIARANCDDPDFFTSSVYATQQDAIADFVSDHYGDMPAEPGEYLLIEVASIKRLEHVLHAKMTRVDMKKLIRKPEAALPDSVGDSPEVDRDDA